MAIIVVVVDDVVIVSLYCMPSIVVDYPILLHMSLLM